MNNRTIAVFTLVLLGQINALGCRDEIIATVQDNAADSVRIALEDWKLWAEGTDSGLWENNASHAIILDLLHVYGGESDHEPLFYAPESFAIRGDTIYVSDRALQKLTAFNSEGNILWQTDGFGEGPGRFSGISQVDVLGDLIAVLNTGNARIDIYDHNGIWINSIPVSTPYDIRIVGDSLLVVAKHTTSEGCLLILSIDGDVLASFGEWEDHSAGWGANRDLHFTISDSLIVLTSYYSNRVTIYCMSTYTRLSSFSRNLPFEAPLPEYQSGGSGWSVSLFPIILDVYIGPEGMINVLLRPLTQDRRVSADSRDIAGVSIVDRFDYEGNYLDSYIIPESASQVVYSSGRLYVMNEYESSLSIYSVTIGK